MKRIYLVRHGEAEGNEKAVFKNPDAKMTERGHRQAKELADRCKQLSVEIIISSPNTRAIETAQYISNSCNVSYEVKPFFAAIKYASSMIGRSKTGPEMEQYMKIIKELYSDPEARFEDAENFNDLKDRFNKGFEHLTQSDYETMIVVTHESILKSVLLHVLMKGQQTIDQHIDSKKTIAQFEHLNFMELEYVDKKWKLVKWNY